MLLRCAAFASGFDVDAAEALIETTKRDSIDVLLALHQRGFLDVVRPSGGRFEVTREVREWAGAQPGRTALEQRVDAYYATRARETGIEASAGRLDAPMDWLLAEQENIARVIARADPDTALRCALAMVPAWIEEGPFARAVELLSVALGRGPSDVDAIALARLARAHFALRTDESPVAPGDDLAHARALTCTQPRVEIWSHRIEAEIAWYEGRLHHADRSFTNALAVIDDQITTAELRRERALLAARWAPLAFELGRSERALELAELALAGFAALGAERFHTAQAIRIALLEIDLGRLSSAAERLRRVRSARISRFSDALALHAEARLAHREGRLEEARAAWEQCRASSLARGWARRAGMYAGYAGMAARELGDATAATELLREAISTAGKLRLVALFEAILGGLDAELGRTDAARERIAHANSLAESADDTALRSTVTELAAMPGARGVEAESAMNGTFEHHVARRISRSDRPIVGMVVAADRAYFVIDGKRIDLRRAPVLRVLLGALVERHASRPGEPCSRTELMAVCWPRQRPSPTLANRLRAMIFSLRGQGLKTRLKSDARGWWLDPDLPCVVDVPQLSAPTPASA